MAIRSWTKGVSMDQGVADLVALLPVGENPIGIQVTDTFQQFQYDDTNMSAQETAAANSFLNSNGWNDITV